MPFIRYLSKHIVGDIVLVVIRQYKRFLSPIFGQRCRYYPTCSQYVMDSISGHGFWRGSLIGLWRIIRCNPFSRGGYDPLN